MDGCIALRLRPVYIRVHDLGGKTPRDTYGSLRYIYIYNYQIYSMLVRWLLLSASSPVSPFAVLPLWLRESIRVYLVVVDIRIVKCHMYSGEPNISPRRLITHLLYQMVHHRTTLRGNGQWSATITRTTTTTQTRTWSTKKSSESCAIRSSCEWPYPQARLGAERNPYSTSSETKSGSSSVKIK